MIDHPRPTSYRGIIAPTVAEAASILLSSYCRAQPIKWIELMQLRRDWPRGTPGPFTGELVVIIAPNAYIVHAVWGGWPGAHVMSIRWEHPVKEARRVAA